MRSLDRFLQSFFFLAWVLIVVVSRMGRAINKEVTAKMAAGEGGSFTELEGARRFEEFH